MKLDPTRQLYREMIFMPKEEQIIEGLKKGIYSKVAQVDSVDLEEAYMKTNSMDYHWSGNEGVIQIGTQNRSTSVGDIEVLNDKIYIVSEVGFKQLPDDCKQYIEIIENEWNCDTKTKKIKM